jgi:hypothetical protein
MRDSGRAGMHIAVDPYLLRTENGDCWRTETALSAYELLSDDSARQIVLGHEMTLSGDLAPRSPALVRGKSATKPKNGSATTKGFAAAARASNISVARGYYVDHYPGVFAVWYSVVLWPKAHHVVNIPYSAFLARCRGPAPGRRDRQRQRRARAIFKPPLVLSWLQKFWIDWILFYAVLNVLVSKAAVHPISVVFLACRFVVGVIR